MQINLFKQNRFVYKKEKAPADPGAGGGHAEKVGRMGSYAYTEGLGALKKQIEQNVTKGALEDVKKDVDKGTEEPAEEIKKRITDTDVTKWKRDMNDVYQGKEKLRDKYFEKVKEAIEKIGMYELYDFINDHTPAKDYYYERGEWKNWNWEFVQLINPYLPDDLVASEKQTQRHKWIVGGLQYAMLDYFKNNLDRADIFQAGKSKNQINPFIHTDAKLGCYTISVMAEYWNHKYGESNPDKVPLVNGDLDETYANKRNNRAVYNRALAYLNGVIAGEITPDMRIAKGPAAPEVAPPRPETREEKRKRKLQLKLIERGIKDEALFAFEQAYNKEVDEAIKKIIKEKDLDIRDPESWLAIHNALSNPEGQYYSEIYQEEFESSDIPSLLAEVKMASAHQEAYLPVAVTTGAAEAEKPKLKSEIKEESIREEVFVRRLRAKINQSGLDFNQTYDEGESIEELALKVYKMCEDNGLPTSEKLMDRVVKKLKDIAEDENIDFGEEYWDPTATSDREQQVTERRILLAIERHLKETYLEGELAKEEEEGMSDDDFIAEVIMTLDDENLDFMGWFITGNEYDAREEFAENALALCKQLGLTPSIKVIKDTIKVLKDNFMLADNDIEYYSDPDNEELEANKKVMDAIKDNLMEKYKIKSQVIVA